MALIYYKLILFGKKTIEEVPLNLRPEVQILLDQSNV
ncbi:CD1375 family protein [Paenibacillus sp. GCM10023248]|nr:CD1375 family protein [Paenibacillus sp. MAHUQ-63]MDD9266043.1 CD1375 family protein [Paenibacillus sp. MAHUQ-63]